MSTILYLGPQGTHSHDAACQHFGEKARLIPCLSHFDVFEQLCASTGRQRPLAIVPVENSSEGPVTQTLDQLAAHPETTVRSSFSMPVRHHLLTQSVIQRLQDIHRVYSHPQALGQCRATLDRLLPHAERLPESSTAAAARRAAQEPHSAALASDAAARINTLRILRRDLQDSNENTTRFFVISTADRKPCKNALPASDTRSLIHLILGNRPGALLHALAPFDAAEVNLTFIQSRPLPGRPWEYGFFIEAVTDWQTAAAAAAWHLVLALSETSRIIGTYPVE